MSPADTPPMDLRLLDPEAAQRRIEETLLKNAARPLFTGTAVRPLLMKHTLVFTQYGIASH